MGLGPVGLFMSSPDGRVWVSCTVVQLQISDWCLSTNYQIINHIFLDGRLSDLGTNSRNWNYIQTVNNLASQESADNWVNRS